MTLQTARAPVVGIATYHADPLCARIECAVNVILAKGNIVAPVDVMIGMDLLRADQLEEWRRGQVPYLEWAIAGNLSRLSRLLRILRFHAHGLNLRQSVTVYMRRGKGARQRLRFTKSGDAKLEEAYATRFVWPGNSPSRRPNPVEPRA